MIETNVVRDQLNDIKALLKDILEWMPND